MLKLVIDNSEEDDFDSADELEYQPHLTDDPAVWGLLDIAIRRDSEVPQTIYMTSGDSASGVIGRRTAEGVFIIKDPTRVGNLYRLQDGGADDGQLMPKGRILPTHGAHINAALPTSFETEVQWDGAAKSPDLENEEGEMTSEHSRGLLLGNYSIHRVSDRRGQPAAEGEWRLAA